MKYDAIVIGAGPGGTSTAIALAQRGRSVALVERADFPRRKVCGEFMSAVNLELLDRLAVGHIVRERAGPEVKRVGLFSSGPGIEAAMPAAGGGDFGRALGRDVLDTALVAAAITTGVEVFQPWRATAIAGHGAASRVRIEAGGETLSLHAPVVVAAHGSWEPGPLPSNLEKHHGPRDFLGFKAHFTGARMAGDLMPLLAFPGGYGGMVWADDGRLSLSCCIRRDVLSQLRRRYMTLSAAEAVQCHLTASCPAVAAVLADAVVLDRWLAAGPIRPGIRQVYRDDIFRVGNIAGESHPVIAEGISMALQGGWLLAAELTGIDLHEPGQRALAGRRYRRVWDRQFATRIRVASLLSRLASDPAAAFIMTSVVRSFPVTLGIGARLSGKTRDLPPVGHSDYIAVNSHASIRHRKQG